VFSKDAASFQRRKPGGKQKGKGVGQMLTRNEGLIRKKCGERTTKKSNKKNTKRWVQREGAREARHVGGDRTEKAREKNGHLFKAVEKREKASGTSNLERKRKESFWGCWGTGAHGTNPKKGGGKKAAGAPNEGWFATRGVLQKRSEIRQRLDQGGNSGVREEKIGQKGDCRK